MDRFDLFFGFFSLLIAFAFAELLNGFVFTARAGLINRSGALAIALAALVLADLVSFWAQLWDLRAYIPAAYGALLIATLPCSLLFIAAKLVLPQADSGMSLEDHFFSTRRVVIPAVVAANIPTIILMIVHNPYPRYRIEEQVVWVTLFAIIALARRRWVLWMALSLLAIFYLWFAILTLMLSDLPAPPS